MPLKLADFIETITNGQSHPIGERLQSAKSGRSTQTVLH
jgi:hypothetical protein